MAPKQEKQEPTRRSERIKNKPEKDAGSNSASAVSKNKTVAGTTQPAKKSSLWVPKAPVKKAKVTKPNPSKTVKSTGKGKATLAAAPAKPKAGVAAKGKGKATAAASKTVATSSKKSKASTSKAKATEARKEGDTSQDQAKLSTPKRKLRSFAGNKSHEALDDNKDPYEVEVSEDEEDDKAPASKRRKTGKGKADGGPSGSGKPAQGRRGKASGASTQGSKVVRLKLNPPRRRASQTPSYERPGSAGPAPRTPQQESRSPDYAPSDTVPSRSPMIKRERATSAGPYSGLGGIIKREPSVSTRPSSSPAVVMKREPSTSSRFSSNRSANARRQGPASSRASSSPDMIIKPEPVSSSSRSSPQSSARSRSRSVQISTETVDEEHQVITLDGAAEIHIRPQSTGRQAHHGAAGHQPK